MTTLTQPEADFDGFISKVRKAAAKSLRESLGWSDCDDLVQEVALKFLKGSKSGAYNLQDEKWQDPRFVRAFVEQVKNTIWRYHTREKRGGGEIPAPLEAVEDFLGQAEASEENDPCEAYNQLIKEVKMSATEQKVFRARALHGLTPDEVADELGLTKNTVNNTLSRARRKIRKFARRKLTDR
jgi:RNA polymerase sigma factor (sigma-70 family)